MFCVIESRPVFHHSDSEDVSVSVSVYLAAVHYSLCGLYVEDQDGESGTCAIKADYVSSVYRQTPIALDFRRNECPNIYCFSRNIFMKLSLAEVSNGLVGDGVRELTHSL